MSHSAIVQKFRKLVWLLSESDTHLYRDLWGALLRRIRHESDISTRKPHPDLLSRVERILDEATDGQWDGLHVQHDDTAASQVDIFLRRCDSLHTNVSPGILREWWKKLRAIADGTCKELERCAYQTEFKVKECFPCPRLMDELRRSGATPEDMVFRMNRTSSEQDLTVLGSILKEFMSEDVLASVQAAYFTFYHPGDTFRNNNMGWVSVSSELRPDIAKSWNFIHWAREKEMDAFLSPSRIIRGLPDPERLKFMLTSHWVMSSALVGTYALHESPLADIPVLDSRPSEADFVSRLDRMLKECTKNLHSAHSLRSGLQVFSRGGPPLKDIHIINIPFERTGGSDYTHFSLHDILPLPPGIAIDGWPRLAAERFGAFAERVFHNEWPCHAYLRFPVLSGLQLSRGADVFIALRDNHIDTIMCALHELTEPLAICASLIDGQMAYKAAHLLEQDVTRNMASLLRHELKTPLSDIESTVRMGSVSSDISVVAKANRYCLYLTKALYEQLGAVRTLGSSAGGIIAIEQFEDILIHYADVLPDLAMRGFTAKVQIAGFTEREPIDRRALLICILLLQNARIHSTSGVGEEPPGVNLSVTKTQGGLADAVSIESVSWYSSDPPEVLNQSFLQARFDRPGRSFDGMLAAARDLNPDTVDPRACFEILGEDAQKSTARGKRWRIRLIYQGRYITYTLEDYHER